MTRPQDRLLPVLVRAPHDNGPRERPESRTGRGSRPENPFAAHLLGQDGQRRGLRGGAPGAGGGPLGLSRGGIFGGSTTGVRRAAS